MLDIGRLLGETGDRREAGGNEPLLLDRADRVWIVETGRVNVFSVRLDCGRPVGARQSLFTAPAGDIILGVDPAGACRDRGILAVGGVGTVLCELELSSFLELACESSKADDLERLMRRWIRNVSLALGRKEVAPRDSKDLDGEGRLSVGRSRCVHPSLKTVWLRVESGRAAFMGRPEFPELAPGGLFPLAKGSWLEATEDCVLSFQEAWPCIDGGELRLALEAFSSFALECALANARKAEAAELARMLRREEARRSMLAQGLSRLAFILRPRRRAVEAETSEREPLLAACSMVARALGIEIESSKIGPSEERGESLEDICRVSGFRYRQVALRGDWWRRDNGPLLVYREEDGRPLAAIPLSRKSYELLDPVDGAALRVDRSLADSLSGSAHVFYRPFPGGALKGFELVRLGLRGCARDIATALAVGACGALLSLLAPWMTGLLFDDIIPEADGGQLVQLAAILGISAFVTLMFDIAKGIALVRVEGKMDGSVQAALWDRLLSLSVPFFGNYSAGDLAERSMGISAIRAILSGIVVSTVLASLLSLANLGLMFHYSSSLAWLGVGLCLVGLGFVLSLSLLLVRRERRVAELEGKNLGIILQLITGIAKLRVSGAEDGAFALWADSFAEKKKHSYRAGKLEALLSSFNSIYPILALMAVFMWLTWKLEGGLSTGSFVAFFSAFMFLQYSLLQMGMAIVVSLGIVPIYDRLRPIVETLPEADDSKQKPGRLAGRVEANHLRYRYYADGPLVLKDLSVSVASGEFVAIVGGSGSGKSTLLRLLLGFAAPDAGAVYYDGQDLSALDLRSVRRQLGVVLQQGQLMPGDIRSTILGSSKLTIEDAWEAARMVGLDEDIREMPMGMYTVIPAGGGTLSGGQRQRLVIARAIVRKPRILFFDEATSALDNRTQAIVSRSLEALQVSRLVIAHRLSTVAKADRIYVMDKGEVVEQGGYEELMASGGHFAALAKRQIA